MSKQTIKIFFIFLLIAKSSLGICVNNDPKRTEEIKQLMWGTKDPDFAVTEIPDKWKNKSAVIIAKSNTLLYKKPPILAYLNHDKHTHERIKLLDKAAIEEYAQFTIPENVTYGYVTSKFYAGFKVIKADGKEIEISLDEAVKEIRQLNGRGYDIYKIAIPNLEQGDILDYFMAEEKVYSIAKYYSFDPLIFQLHEEYPIMKQKIVFDVMRRCFINLKSSNGAPDFILEEDAKNDKNHYSLEDADRESVKDIRWMYHNRQLATIKFRVTYASPNYTSLSGILGTPGVLKSNISKIELQQLLDKAFTSANYYAKPLIKQMKKEHKKERNLDVLGREAFYVHRNLKKIQHVESLLLSNEDPNANDNIFRDVATLSEYYRRSKIPHEVIIGVPRVIAKLDDLILENELTFMIKVKTANPFYIGKYGNHDLPGQIDPSLEGTQAYAVNGTLPPSRWVIQEIEIPAHAADENNTYSETHVTLIDLEKETAAVAMKRGVTGENKAYVQDILMDYYNYEEEERAKYDMPENFEEKPRYLRKVLEKRKIDYLANREKVVGDALKEMLEGEIQLKTEEVSNLKILETGRFEDKPAFVYAFDAQLSGVAKKAGANYLLEIGKFIDQQVEIKQEEKERDYDIYLPFARSYNYLLKVEIPEGYVIQGIDQLSTNVQNETGGFSSKAKMVGNQLIVESHKYYSHNFEKKENWPLMLDFLKAAYDFSQKKVLLKKI